MVFFKQLNVASQGTTDDFPLYIRHLKRQDNCAAHYHDFVELCIILSGHGKHIVGNSTASPVEAGDILLIPRGTIHRFTDNTPDLSLTNILYIPEKLQIPILDAMFHPGFKPLFFGECPDNGAIPHFHLEADDFRDILFLENKLRQENSSRLPGYRFNMLGTFMILLSELARHYIRFSDTVKESRINVTNLMEYIRRNYKNTISTAKLCAIANMCKSSLMEYFKNATGTTPLQYQLHLRISNAAKLLSESALDIGEIALQSGFTDSNYFSRQFKRITGMSPSEYRKNNLQTEYNPQKRNE